jgi:DNA-binding response OmpR family regulator
MSESSKKILIVEDDKDFLWILRQSFDNQGLDVAYALDGQEGLEKAKQEKPDLIIADIGLPKIDGIAMAKAIREAGISAKIIFLTNLSDPDHISKALEAAGETDYMVKADVAVDQILKRVKEKVGA